MHQLNLLIKEKLKGLPIQGGLDPKILLGEKEEIVVFSKADLLDDEMREFILSEFKSKHPNKKVRKRFGICIDTCHIYASGYNICDKTIMDDYFNNINKIIFTYQYRTLPYHTESLFPSSKYIFLTPYNHSSLFLII